MANVPVEVSLHGGGFVRVEGPYTLRLVHLDVSIADDGAEVPSTPRAAVIVDGCEYVTAFDDIARLRAAIDGKREALATSDPEVT